METVCNCDTFVMREINLMELGSAEMIFPHLKMVICDRIMCYNDVSFLRFCYSTVCVPYSQLMKSGICQHKRNALS
jgi:hypothetical protein